MPRFGLYEHGKRDISDCRRCGCDSKQEDLALKLVNLKVKAIDITGVFGTIPEVPQEGSEGMKIRGKD